MEAPRAMDAAEQRPGTAGFGISALSLLVSNLAVVWLILAHGLTPFQLVLVFWCECVWIGIFNALKLFTASLLGNPFENRFANVSPAAAVFSSLLVIVFSGFMFVAFLGLILLPTLAVNEIFVSSGAADGDLDQVGLVLGASLALMAGHALSFVVNFLLLGEFKSARVGALVAQPFKRCSALLAAIVFSLVVIAIFPSLASTAVFGTLVLVGKIVWDLQLHRAERRAFAPPLG